MTGVLLLAVALFALASFVTDPGQIPFDSQIWKNASRTSTANKPPEMRGPVGEVRKQQDRGRMVKDLLKRYELIGMNESEVNDLLGPDDGYFRTKYSHDNQGDWQRTYRLGAPTLNPMDFSVRVLLLKVRDGKVTDAKLKVYYD